MRGLCEILPWDSDFFGFAVARVVSSELNARQAAKVLAWCREQSVKCVYFQCGGLWQPSVQVVQKKGFELVDIRVELNLLKRPAPKPEKTSARIRPFRPGDLPFLERIARYSHTESRFFRDPNFSRTAAQELYATWIRRDCEGFADRVWVALNTSKIPVGYLSCKVDRLRKIGWISLFAMAEDQKRQGYGKRLVGYALDWLAEQNTAEARVVTQAGNISAQRLYQICGFRTLNVSLWFHKWF